MRPGLAVTAALAAWMLGGGGAARAADFRLVALTGTLATVFDADATEATGDIRVATFYTATSEANLYSRTRLQFDCANRKMRPESIVIIDPMTGKGGKERLYEEGWARADGTVSDSRTMKLVCSAPEGRDTYGQHLPDTNWRTALINAFAPLRTPFALAFDLPVDSKDLVCTGGAVVRPAAGAPVPTNGAFRAEVDIDQNTILFRDPLGPGVASDFAIQSARSGGLRFGTPAGDASPATGRLDFASRVLHLEGVRSEASGGGSFAADLHCAAARPMP